MSLADDQNMIQALTPKASDPAFSVALRRSPQGNIELMTQKEVLNFKLALRLEQIRDKCPKQVDDHKHCIDDALILVHRANLGWIEFSGMTGVGRHWRPQDIGGELFKLVGRGWAQSCAR